MSEPQYISQGTYGCAYRPSISCDKNPPKPNTISKIFPDEKKMKDEMNKYQNIPATLVEANDKDRFFIMPLQGCKIKLEKLGIGYSECTLLEEYIDDWEYSGRHEDDMPIWQIIYPDGGIDIYKMLSLKSMEHISFGTIFMSMESLFKGLVHLKKHNLIHQDIKIDNLTFNDYLVRSYMIDFGVMTKAKNVYSEKNSHIYTYLYRYYPPEYTLATLLIGFPESKRINDDYIVKLFNKEPNYVYTIMINFSGYTNKHVGTGFGNRFLGYKGFYPIYLSNTVELLRDNYKDDELTKLYTNIIFWWEEARVQQVNDMLDTIESKAKKDISNLLEKQVSKIDVYMFGMALLETFVSCLKQDRIHISVNIMKKILKLIMNMTNFNVFKRYTPEQALSDYRKIILMYDDRELIEHMPKRMVVASKEIKSEEPLLLKGKPLSRKAKSIMTKRTKDIKEHKRVLEELRKAQISLHKRTYGKDYRTTAELLDAIFKAPEIGVEDKKIFLDALSKRIEELKTLKKLLPSNQRKSINGRIAVLKRIMNSSIKSKEPRLTSKHRSELSKI